LMPTNGLKTRRNLKRFFIKNSITHVKRRNGFLKTNLLVVASQSQCLLA
jgi:hypothetical protein